MSTNFSWPRVNSALPPSSPLHPSNPTGCNQNKGSLTFVSNHCSPLLRVQPVPSTTRKWAMQGRSCNTGALRCPATGCRALSVSLETETLLEAESMLSCSVPSTQKGLSAGTGWGIRLKSSQKCYRKVGCNRPQITLFIFQWIPLALPLLCSCPLLPSVNTLIKSWQTFLKSGNCQGFICTFLFQCLPWFSGIFFRKEDKKAWLSRVKD